jgi:hypothetical protein
MTWLDVFNLFKPFLSHGTDWNQAMVEQFELNDIAGCVHSIQTIASTQHRLKPWYMIEHFELNDTAKFVHSIQTIASTWHRLKPSYGWTVWTEWHCWMCSIHSNHVLHRVKIGVTIWLNSLNWMTLLHAFNPLNPLLAYGTDWSHIMIEQFELNDVAACVHSIQTIASTQHRLKPWYMIEHFELNDTAKFVHSIQTIASIWHRLKPSYDWTVWIEWHCWMCSFHSNYFFHIAQIEAMLWLNGLNWMMLLDVFILFKPFLPHSTDCSDVMIEQFEQNGFAGSVQSMQAISCT